jgi:hypothetical protein
MIAKLQKAKIAKFPQSSSTYFLKMSANAAVSGHSMQT